MESASSLATAAQRARRVIMSGEVISGNAQPSKPLFASIVKRAKGAIWFFMGSCLSPYGESGCALSMISRAVSLLLQQLRRRRRRRGRTKPICELKPCSAYERKQHAHVMDRSRSPLQEEPGRARKGQGEPGGASRSQEEPGRARRGQDEPRGARRSQEGP